MSKLNTPIVDVRTTHEGGRARRIGAEAQLRRLVLSCLLWEDTFYIDGKAVADQITEAANNVPIDVLAQVAFEARTKYHLRHVPLLLLCILAQRGRGKSITGSTIAATINRVDELAEFLAVYAKYNGTTPDKLHDSTHALSSQVKRGLREAFAKFDEYQFSKYNREGAIKLRDVMFLVRPNPNIEGPNTERASLYSRIASNQLQAPDTWEVALSGGADKKETFTRLLTENRLGYLALLRNLRNMVQAGVDTGLITSAIVARRGAHNVLPFRYVAAARVVPQFEPALDQALLASIDQMEKLPGTTVVLVDVSGSMDGKLSDKSDLTRLDAAATLASIVPAQNLRVFTFSNRLVECPPRKGMAGIDTIVSSQIHSATYLGRALSDVHANIPHDRIIVISDEQTADPIPNPVCKKAYMINVAPYRNGVGYGPWVHIDGFSEHVLQFIQEYENEYSE